MVLIIESRLSIGEDPQAFEFGLVSLVVVHFSFVRLQLQLIKSNQTAKNQLPRDFPYFIVPILFNPRGQIT